MEFTLKHDIYEYLLGLTRREKIIESKKFSKNGESFEKIAKQLQISIITASKYVKMDESQIPKEHISTREQEHIDAVNKIKSKIEKVKFLKEQGLSDEEIENVEWYAWMGDEEMITHDSSYREGLERKSTLNLKLKCGLNVS